MSETRLAKLTIERTQSKEPGGMDHYDGPVFEQLTLEQRKPKGFVRRLRPWGRTHVMEFPENSGRFSGR